MLCVCAKEEFVFFRGPAAFMSFRVEHSSHEWLDVEDRATGDRSGCFTINSVLQNEINGHTDIFPKFTDSFFIRGLKCFGHDELNKIERAYSMYFLVILQSLFD